MTRKDPQVSRQPEPAAGKWLHYLLLAAILAWAGLFYAHKVNFTASDLGRHIRNGQVFLQDPSAITFNYYSYTEPGFPTNTHHWASGVIFFMIYFLTGFAGLGLFNMLLQLGAVFLVFRASRLNAPFFPVFAALLLCLPFFTNRTEIRPESFSYLLFAAEYYFLMLFRHGKVQFRALLITVVIVQVLWVNLHIFFVFGLLLLGMALLSSYFSGNENRKLRLKYLLLLLAGVAGSFVSPFGYKAFLEPFTIFTQYGYMVAENQPVLFMQGRDPSNPVYYYFEAFVILTLAIHIVLVFMKKGREVLFSGTMSLILAILTFRMVRGMALFGFILVPALSQAVSLVWPDNPAKRKANALAAVVLFTAFIAGLAAFPGRLFSPGFSQAGFGLMPKVNRSAEFFRMNNISGPVFNNYDIGGYLIFHLFPDYRVFVDNRPEAYSPDFFRKIYVPMQENEQVWQEMCRRYQFNAIYFYRHDITPWAQPFLIRRLGDPEWVPVFVDAYTLILLKRNRQNEDLIRRYELPQEMFRAVPN